MKWLLLLFPIYLLYLSGIPCSPNDRCCQEEIQAFAKQTAAGDNDNTKDKKADFPCSPFFPCGACHGVVLTHYAVYVMLTPTPIAKQPSLYIEKPLLAFSAPIWQPPKQA